MGCPHKRLAAHFGPALRSNQLKCPTAWRARTLVIVCAAVLLALGNGGFDGRTEVRGSLFSVRTAVHAGRGAGGTEATAVDRTHAPGGALSPVHDLVLRRGDGGEGEGVDGQGRDGKASVRLSGLPTLRMDRGLGEERDGASSATRSEDGTPGYSDAGVRADPAEGEGGLTDETDQSAGKVNGGVESAAMDDRISARVHLITGPGDVVRPPLEGAGEPFSATHYCRDYEDCPYTGSGMGCTGQPYDPYDPTIVAVGPSRYAEWPCGTRFRVCAQGNANRSGAPLDGAKKVGNVPSVQCVDVVRVDSCPGCSHYLVDLSEAAFEALGFRLEQGVGRVTVERSER